MITPGASSISPESEKVLSPEWIDKAGRGDKPEVPAVDAHTAAMLQGTDFAVSETKVNNSDSNPFFTPPHTPNGPEKLPGEPNECPDMSTTSTQVNHTQRAAQAFESAGLKWKPRKFDLLAQSVLGNGANTQQSQFNLTARKSIASSPSTLPTVVRDS